MFDKQELEDLRDFTLLGKTLLFNIDRDFKYKHIEDEEPLTPEEQKKHLEDYENLRQKHTGIVNKMDKLIIKIQEELNERK